MNSIVNFALQNGITIIKSVESGPFEVTTYLNVERNNRTDEQIEQIIRQYKVLYFITLDVPSVVELKMKYKIV